MTHEPICNGKCKHIKIQRKIGVSLYDLGCVRCLHGCDCYFKKSKAIRGKRGRLLCPCCGGFLKSGTYYKPRKRVSKSSWLFLPECQLCKKGIILANEPQTFFWFYHGNPYHYGCFLKVKRNKEIMDFV